MRPVVIEAALNEDTSPERNPRVPISPEAVGRDALAVVEAGASLVHFHARDDAGVQTPADTAFYRTAATALRERRDVLWYPPQGEGPDPAERWRHVLELAGDPEQPLEFISIDPGSFDLMSVDADTGSIRVPPMQAELGAVAAAGGTVVPPVAQWVWFCETAQRLGLSVVFGVFEPGWLRRIVTFSEAGLVGSPLVLHLFLTERLGFGLPAVPESLDRYLELLPDDLAVEWICCPLGVSSATEDRLLRHALERGGHVRAGVGCVPTDGDFEDSNATLVGRAAALVERMGLRPASPAEARELLGAPPPPVPR